MLGRGKPSKLYSVCLEGHTEPQTPNHSKRREPNPKVDPEFGERIPPSLPRARARGPWLQHGDDDKYGAKTNDDDFAANADDDDYEGFHDESEDDDGHKTEHGLADRMTGCV